MWYFAIKAALIPDFGDRLESLRWTVSLKGSWRNTLVRYFALFAKHIQKVHLHR